MFFSADAVNLYVMQLERQHPSSGHLDLFVIAYLCICIYAYIYVVLVFLHNCPLLIPLHNTAVLIKICRFLINVVKFMQNNTINIMSRIKVHMKGRQRSEFKI